MTVEQAAAFAHLRGFARLGRFRVVQDLEGFPLIPGRLGQIEYHDGRALAVFTDRPRLHAKLWAIPGVRRHQTGDQEMRALFPRDALGLVAGVIRARRRAIRPMTPERLAALAAGRRQTLAAPPVGATSRSQDRVGAAPLACEVGAGAAPETGA